VFDYAQTDGEPLPELNTNATEGGDALLPLLERAAAQLNITLVYKAIEGSAEGLSKGGLIEIEETLDTPARCGVIAHELAHELAHKTNREGTTRQQRELEAESVAYAVLAHFGMHQQSCFYLATYDVTPEMLTASLQTICSAAKTIISLIDSTGYFISSLSPPSHFSPSIFLREPSAAWITFWALSTSSHEIGGAPPENHQGWSDDAARSLARTAISASLSSECFRGSAIATTEAYLHACSGTSGWLTNPTVNMTW
jgi:hypothetical protein